MKKIGLISLFLTLTGILFCYGQVQDKYITTWKNPLTGHTMAKLNLNEYENDRIENETEKITCDVSSGLEEVKIRGENLLNGNVEEIDNKYWPIKQEWNLNNHFVVITRYWRDTEKIASHVKCYRNPNQHGDQQIELGVLYRYKKNGGLRDSLNFEQNYGITIQDVLDYIKENFAFFKPYAEKPDSLIISREAPGYDLPETSDGLENTDPGRQGRPFTRYAFHWENHNCWVITAVVKEQQPGIHSFAFDGKTGEFLWHKYVPSLNDQSQYSDYPSIQQPVFPNIRHRYEEESLTTTQRLLLLDDNMQKYVPEISPGTTICDTVLHDQVKTIRLVRNIKYITLTAKYKDYQIQVQGDTRSGFGAWIYYSKFSERYYFDNKGNQKEYQEFYEGTNKLKYSCQYDSQGNIIKEEHYKKE